MQCFYSAPETPLFASFPSIRCPKLWSLSQYPRQNTCREISAWLWLVALIKSQPYVKQLSVAYTNLCKKIENWVVSGGGQCTKAISENGNCQWPMPSYAGKIGDWEVISRAQYCMQARSINKKGRYLYSVIKFHKLLCFINYFRKICIYNLHKIVILFETSVQFPSISECFIFKSSKSHFLR